MSRYSLGFQNGNALTLAYCFILGACGGGSGSSPSAGPTNDAVGNDAGDSTSLCEDLADRSYILSPVTSENDLYDITTGSPVFESYGSVNEPYSFQVIEDPGQAESGNLVERYELRTGDCLEGDCSRSPPRYRSETISLVRNIRGETEWFAFSFKLGDRFDLSDSPTGRWKNGPNITQWAVEAVTADSGEPGDGNNEFLGNLFLYVDYGSGDLILQHQISSFQNGTGEYSGYENIATVARAGTFEDQWNYVVARITFDQNASLNLYFNGTCVADYRGDTLGAGWDDAFWKWGLYRASTEAERRGDETLIQSIYFDNFRNGDTYEDIGY